MLWINYSWLEYLWTVFFIIALIIISPFLLIFFSTYLSLCEHLFQLCHVLHAAAPFLNSQNVQTSNISVDLRAIDNSLQDLKNASYQSAYSKQKCSLHTELEKFLASLPNSKTILPASPTDINCFLAWKDLHGKTVVHSDGCSDSHLQSTAKCKCAKCLGCRNLMAPSSDFFERVKFSLTYTEMAWHDNYVTP